MRRGSVPDLFGACGIEGAMGFAISTIEQAAAALRRGSAAIFPTDTVFGLGVSVRDAASPRILFDLKKRDAGKPVAWLVGGEGDLAAYGSDVPGYAFSLARAFWPGPLTLIVRASDAVPRAFQSEAGTIGLRMPASDTALALIRAVGCPLATTSANRSGAPAPYRLESLDVLLALAVGTVVTDEGEKSGVASTVVDCTGDRPVIVGERALTASDVDACSNVETEALSFESADGRSRIHGMLWMPGLVAASRTRPRGIVQLVHGMSEHIGRYDDFARFLASRGFVVCGHDHIGHGRSAAAADDLGHIPLAAGKEALVADVQELRRIVSVRFADDVPFVLFGHSMGSFIAYCYLARHAEGLAAAVLCGTGRLPAALSRAGNRLARAICAVKGERFVSKILHGMGAGAYSKQIDDPRTEFDWLSVDPAVVDAYIDDPLCGALFTAGGYAALTDLTHEIATPACAAAIPDDLPILFIGGEDDPVGDCGRGVARARDLLVEGGAQQVTMRLYPGMRHEILNEPDRARVYRDVLEWIEAAIAMPRAEAAASPCEPSEEGEAR